MEIKIVEQQYKDLVKGLINQHPYIRNMYLMILSALDGRAEFTGEEAEAQYKGAQDINSMIFEIVVTCMREQINKKDLMLLYEDMGLPIQATEEQ